MELLGVELVPHERSGTTTAGEDRERVADGQSVLDVVGDEDDAQAPASGGDDVAEDEGRLLDAQGRRRLVEDKHTGTEIFSPGDGKRLPFTAGQGPDRLVRVTDLDPDPMHLLPGDRGRRRHIEAPERPNADGRLVAQEEIPGHAHQRHDREILIDGRDAGIERVAR